MKNVSISGQDFATIIHNDLFYIDKTAFIHEWFERKEAVTIITRPRRFGKTLLLDMLNSFFSVLHAEDHDLFAHLKIATDPLMKPTMDQQGSFPVLALSFGTIKSDNIHDFLFNMGQVFLEIYLQYKFITEDSELLDEDYIRLFNINKNDLLNMQEEYSKDPKNMQKYIPRLKICLHSLCSILQQYYKKKVYIFLDEYDAPLELAYINGFYDEIIVIMRAFFLNTFKINASLDRAIIAGITKIAQESLFSDFNNPCVSTVLQGSFETACGFSLEDMNVIYNEFQLDKKQQAVIRKWYEGFNFGSVKDIYNPWSVINYIYFLPNPPKRYWTHSGGIKLVEHLVCHGSARIHADFQTLLEGKEIDCNVQDDLIYPDLMNNPNAVWSLLVAAGYLKPIHHRGYTKYALTNYEVQLGFIDMIRNWYNLNGEDYSHAFAEAFLAGNLTAMNMALQHIVDVYVSMFDTAKHWDDDHRFNRPENFFHGLTLGLLVCLCNTYNIRSNIESGGGRFDLCLEPKKRKLHIDASILEFKIFGEQDQNLKDTAQRARAQIDLKHYDTHLKDIGYSDEHIRKYGLGFRGKEVLIVT